MKVLDSNIAFPKIETTSKEGIIAIGGDLSTARLLLAYRSGIFPWFNDGEPIIWWAPNPRMVLFLDELKISKSMKTVLKRNLFEVTFNTNFKAVILNCKQIEREGQPGTWITTEMADAYCKLHELGIAKSIEVWQNGELVGGLYGIDLGHIFCGESMFSKVSNASKVAFISLINQLKKDNYALLDCQVYNEHLASLGCREIDRSVFMQILEKKK